MLETGRAPATLKNGYPTSDGRPTAETDFHRQLMMALIEALEDRYVNDPNVYVSGNLLLYYEAGNKRKHVSPDVFVVFGVPRHRRLNYLLWEEGPGPSVVIELTSSSTRKEDKEHKFRLYRDVLRVPEYFLFDPFGDYLRPRLQGFRLASGEYRRMRLSDGRLRSRKLGLVLEPDGDHLRLVDPVSGRRLLTRDEARAVAEAARSAAEQARQAAEAARDDAEQARRAAEAENARLRREIEEIRRKRNGV